MTELEQSEFYLVVNNEKPIIKSWSFNLFSQKMRDEWEEYRQSKEYIGEGTEMISKRRAMPESIKIQEWVNRNQYGHSHYERTSTHPEGVTNYKFILKEGENVLTEEQIKSFVMYHKREIEQKLKPGELKPKIHNEGFLEITPISEKEAEKKLSELNKEPIDEKTEELDMKEIELEEREREIAEREARLKKLESSNTPKENEKKETKK